MQARPQARPQCPFYGFHWPARGSNLIDMRTDECGLDFNEHGPCQMERRQMPVDFDSCPRRSERQNLIDAGKRYIRFYGVDLPTGGLALEAWQNLVMNRK